MPDLRASAAARFDGVGYAMLAFGMVAISLAIDGVSGLGLRQAGVLLLLVFGFASITAYWLHALRHPDPLFEPALFGIPTLSIGLLGNLFSRLGSGCMPFLIPLLLQVSHGLFADASRADDAADRAGRHGDEALRGAADHAPRLSQGAGRQHHAGGTDDGELRPGDTRRSRSRCISLQLIVFGAVNSLQFTAMNTITLRDLEGGMASSGNSLLSMVQMLAMSLGVAAASAVLAGYSGDLRQRDAGGDTPCLPGHIRDHGAHHAGFSVDFLASAAGSPGRAAGAARGVGPGLSAFRPGRSAPSTRAPRAPVTLARLPDSPRIVLRASQAKAAASTCWGGRPRSAEEHDGHAGQQGLQAGQQVVVERAAAADDQQPAVRAMALQIRGADRGGQFGQGRLHVGRAGRRGAQVRGQPGRD